MVALKSCETCKQMNTAEIRQGMGCGFEPPAEHGQLWRPRALPDPDPDHPEREFPTVCPGYTVRLPIVLEVSRARVHWTKGELAAFVGAQPSEQLLVAIEVLEASASELHHAQMTPESQGGLAKA